MPLYIMAFLSIGAVCLIGMRMRMEIGKKQRALFESGACKTIGSREIQGDAYGIVEEEDAIMAALADGMGNGFGGKVASRIAVETFEDIFQDKNAFYNPPYSFRRAFHGANKQIMHELNGQRGAASVAAILIKNKKLYYALVGNVKVAVYRNKELVPLTWGHTIGALAKRKYIEGKLTRQQALSLLDRHRLYNYVGQESFGDIEFFDAPIRLYGGEYIVLLSDGMYQGVSWKEIEQCIEEGGSCENMALKLVQLVNGRLEEDMDNASIVIIRMG